MTLAQEVAALRERLTEAEHKLDELPTQVALVARDIGDIRKDVADLKEAEFKAREERRAEFKWRIGTALVSVGLIISAMAVLFSVLGPG